MRLRAGGEKTRSTPAEFWYESNYFPGGYCRDSVYFSPEGYNTLPISSDRKSHKLPRIIELAWKAGVSNWNRKIIAPAAGSVFAHIGEEMGIRGAEFSWAFHFVRALVVGYIKIDVRWYPSLFCRLYWCSCVISLLITRRLEWDAPIYNSRAHLF